ncbi:MAG: response regulator [Beijerinckiaceae bacterium]
MSAHEPVNILLVDDQPAKLLSYEIILSELNENLLKASSAHEAFQHLLTSDVALILIDVCMPDLDGFDLAAMIREHPRFKDTSIIFVSAIMLAEPDRLRGYKAGAVDYVSVPIAPELLRAKVRVFTELYRKTRQLEKLNAELEARVKERTEKLEISNDLLRTLNDELEHRIEERTREREAALQQLFQAQKLDTIGQLTGGVAHDFNNLLMAVLGSMSMVQRKLPKDDPLQKLVGNAVEGAERGAVLTKRLLAFARRQELRPERVNVARLLSGMKDLLARALGPEIETGVSMGADAWVLADANQLELAILNIAVNARDAMPSGGQFDIAVSEEAVEASDFAATLRPGGYVRLRFKDTGFGMDSATLGRASEPFFTTKGPGQGTGLGLSTVHGLAAQLGGRLELASQPGAGTTVDLLLPVAEGDAAGALGVAESSPDVVVESPRCRILVVDDDAMVSLGTVSMLEELGHDAVDVESGAKALRALGADAAFDIVLTDYAMPGMSGLELARTVSRNYPSISIIFATGYAGWSEGAKPSQWPVLSKPFTLPKLSAAIAQARQTIERVERRDDLRSAQGGRA